jgi:hypothetical protein
VSPQPAPQEKSWPHIPRDPCLRTAITKSGSTVGRVSGDFVPELGICVCVVLELSLELEGETLGDFAGFSGISQSGNKIAVIDTLPDLGCVPVKSVSLDSNRNHKIKRPVCACLRRGAASGRAGGVFFMCDIKIVFSFGAFFPERDAATPDTGFGSTEGRRGMSAAVTGDGDGVNHDPVVIFQLGKVD